MFDLLVIGGGATGSGIALDAATRGLKVALVERDDFASGTSSRSTKLIHGGVRYLESAIKHLDRKEFHLVTDALKERKTLLHLAPHLTRALPLVTPLYSWMDIPYYLAGLKLYDWLSRQATIGHSCYLSAKEAISRFPMLKHEGLKGAVLYYDGQFNDARMNVAIAMTAAQHGARIFNHCEVTTLLKKEGYIVGAAVKNLLTGEEGEIHATATINATGPFADAICQLDETAHTPLIAPSSGVHIILDGHFSPPGTGLLIPHTEDGRVLFLLPWENSTLAGTTDHPCPIEATPRPHKAEVDYILRHLNQTFNVTIRPQDIRASWSGIRPLARDPTAHSTSELVRDHLITVSDSQLITIVGGKWTTYRRMAEEAVDRAIEVGGLTASPCQSATTRLIGATDQAPELERQLEAEHQITADVARHLVHSYGTCATEVLASGATTLLAENHPFIEAEVLYGIRHELAATAIDILARRTRLAFLDQGAARQALPRVLALMSEELSWSDEHTWQEGIRADAFLSTMGV